jgi:signal transduction histidine kinase
MPPWWRTWWAYTLFAILFIAAIYALIYYRSRQLRHENKILEEKVRQRTTQLQESIEHLKSTQAQLIQSEKMASLGELTAGIAHEIQNPLNFVNNFSDVSTELLDEMKDELVKGNMDEAIAIAEDIKNNLFKIITHGRRADGIVKGMLQHSRSSSGTKEPTDINALCDEYLRLAYHGFRTKDKSFNVIMKTDFDDTIGLINVIPQDIGRVILNLITNAFYAVSAPKSPGGDLPYEPTIFVSTKLIKSPLGDTGAKRSIGDSESAIVSISVTDNGPGIPKDIIDKIFQPFFTTKPAGQGTGLGLSLSYDIVKAHHGQLIATSEPGKTTFTITIPI